MEKRSFVYLLLFFSIVLFANSVFSLQQQSYILDLQDVKFNFSAYELNDSSTSKELVFSANESLIVWVSLPKNSTILSTLIKIEGLSKPLQATTQQQVIDLDVGNIIPAKEWDEIIVGTAGASQNLKLLNASGHQLWNYSISSEVPAVSIGNLSQDEGLEIVAASNEPKIYVLNSSGNVLVVKTMANIIYDLEVSDIISSPYDEIAVASSDNRLYLLDYDLSEIWNFSASSPFKGVGVGELSSSAGKEIAASSGSVVYLLNSSGQLINSKDVGILINDVDVADVDGVGYDEIAVATNNGTLYMLDNSLNILWSFSASDIIDTVKIGEVTSEYTGKETVIGSYDDYVYVVNKDGSLVWKYKTENDVKGVGIGNLTADPGNEVVAGTQIPATYTLYVLNFEYFPTNPYLDIGNDSSIEWSYSGKFREEAEIANNTAFQQFLNDCSPDERGRCLVPLKFHSDFPGILKIKSINITYEYNITNILKVDTVAAWSRTNEVRANESVGSQIKNISYISNPANDIIIKYISVDDAATVCDFNGTRYSVIAINGKKYCNISSKPRLLASYGNASYDWLWDNSMTSSIAVYYNETQGISQYGFWKKNLTVWNNTPAIFTNVIINTTLDENYITGNSRLKVDWFDNGTFFDITPANAQTNCISMPTYTAVQLGNDTFYVCKQDTNNDGRIDFFIWKQPHTNKSYTIYEVSGSANNPPQVSQVSITPSQDFWGKNFTITANISDVEGNNVSVRVCFNLTHTFNLSQVNFSSLEWQCLQEKNTTNDTSLGEIMTFEIESNKTWTGNNLLVFQLRDFDESIEYHEWFFSNIYFGPNVTKHYTEAILVSGNNSNVNRSQTVLLSIIVNDTVDNSSVANAKCRFWVSINGTHWDEGKDVFSNSSGYCDYQFTPNSSYMPGMRWWKAGIYEDEYYNNSMTQNFTISIYGKININLTEDARGNITRNRLKQIKARIFDEYGKTINESGYQCSFKLNETTIGSNTTSSSGICTIAFLPDCYYDLGEYILNVTLSGEVNPYYIYNKSSDTASIYLKDSLNATILSPSNELYHKNDEMNLSFSLLDSCGIPDKPYSSLWAFNCTTQGYPPYYNTSSEQNTTWQVQCNPGILVLTLKVYGNLYETEIKSKNIDIYGWSQVKLLQPLNGTYNRTETDRKIDIVCEVFDANASSIKLDPYTVDIFYRYEGSEPVKLASKNTVYPTGRVNYTWNISSNETVPEGWYKIACNISDQVLDAYRKYNASVKEDYADILIIEKDTMPPRVNSILVNSTMLNGNTTLYANVTDWYGVSAVWIEMLYPNKTRNTFYLENQSADLRQTIWSINFSSLNLLGDYDIVLYANDTSNYTTINQTWFEVYLPIQLYAETSYPKMYEFYRPGTSLLIHNFTYGTGWHNLTLHQRNYDLKAKIEDEIAQKHEIIFSDLNTTLTSENQFGQISNITNPLNISVIPLSLLNPPVPWRHEVAGVYISTNYAFSNVTVSFDYSKKLSEIDYAPALVIYKCANWTSQCNSGWVSVNTTVNTTSYRAFTVQNATSAYYLFEAEICGNGICGIGESCVNCVADCGECGSGSTGPTPSGVSGGGGGGGYRAYCGNGICDSDENAFTCPQDCTSGFSVKTNLTTDYVMSGAKKGYAIWISNLMSQPIQASILINGPASNLLSLTENLVIIDALKEKEIKLELIVPKNIEPGAYTGEIIVSANNRKERLPITIFVTKEAHEVQLAVKVITKNLKPNETLAFEVSIFSLTQKKEFPANILYTIKAFKDDKIVYSEEEYLLIKTPYQSLKYVRLPENITAGKYYIIVNATYENEMLSSVDSFDVYTSFITAKAIRYAFIGMAAFLALTASIIAFKRYQAWRKARLKYIFPVDFNLLPKGDLSIGKIAETNVKATFDSNELTTHILVAGATGAGKSVTASIFAEEVLSKKIPVVVFDPTAQWTGFVKPCKDENVLKYYKKHGLSVDDAKSYPGNIYEMTDPKAKIDFKKYMNPGEITVFVLNKLKPGEYDEAVTNIIDSIFSQSWEESTTTKLVIVFDEVHRLLEKYGGKGGYVALERACREFRKWGIGLIMVSQVLSDFKEAIKGNVLTEIQMHTKSLSDLQRIEKKYGLEYARRVAKEEVGIGMIQNPKYNKGLPWFVSFRPPLHMPHKITEQEMQMYKEYNSRIEKLEQEIERLEKEGKDVFDLKIELRLAKDKLKKGMFRVAEIYIESLNKKLGLSK